MNILWFCVFTFRVDCEMYSFVENEKYLWLKEDENSPFHEEDANKDPEPEPEAGVGS